MSDINAILSSAKWAEDSYYLKEFVHKFKLPQVAKVVKGQYQNLGVSTLSNPSLTCNVLLVPAPNPRPALIAQSVKFKDGKRVVPVGPKLSIPRSYDGYFEILSEDGRCVRCIESVGELSRRFPETVLVRDNLKAFVSKSDDVESIQEKSRTIASGEVLILVGEVLGVKGKSQSRYLRCLDSGGENIYLPLETKGKFSAIAKEENISGVHNVQNLLKKRLPLMARLVHGNPPQGQKISQTFTSDLRVLCGTEETGILAVPLTKELMSVYLPLTGNLKLQPLANSDFISGMAEVKRIETRAITQFDDWSESILVYDVSIPKETTTLQDKRHNNNSKNHSITQETKRSSLYGIISSRTDHHGNSHNGSHNGSNGGVKQPDDYDEIDQIYDYVRGFAPLPKSAKGWQYIPDPHHLQADPSARNHQDTPTGRKEGKDEKKDSGYGRSKSSKDANHNNTNGKHETTPSAAVNGAENQPPEPPPLETLPSRKNNPSHIDCTPPMTPHYSPPWGSPAHQAGGPAAMLPLHPSNNHHNGGGHPSPSPYNLTLERTQSAKTAENRLYEKSSDSKKRQRPKTADGVSSGRLSSSNNNKDDKNNSKSYGQTTPSHTNRYIKASHKQNNGSGGTSTVKHKFFKSKKDKESNNPPPPLGSKEGGGGLGIQPPSFFHLRYKSLTNLTAQEYDTLDSSNSGGKTSFDSAGSRNIPEKRSRKLVRPKSLTNLAWDFRTGPGNGAPVSQPGTPVHKSYHQSSSGDTLKRSSSKPSLLVADKGRQDGGTTRLRRGVIRGSDVSPLPRRGRNLSSTLYL